MFSEKGQALILHENYKYRKHRILKTTDEEVWYCTKTGCSAKLYILNTVISKKCNSHNHEAVDEVLLIRQRVSPTLLMFFFFEK